MVRRVHRLCILTVSLAMIGALATTVGFTQVTGNRPHPSNVKLANLQEQLLNGLKVTTPQDRAYIGRVIELIDDGELSRGLVVYVFKLARQRRPESPLPYFQRVLPILAKRVIA